MPRCSGNARRREQGRLGLGCSGRPRLASGLWGAPPASNPWPLPLPLPLPRCHMKRGLQVGGPPITQHQCREQQLPRHAAHSLLLAQETGCVLALWRRKLPGTGHRVWTARCGLEAALGGVWASTPERAGRWSGPRSTTYVIHDLPGVCVCLLHEGLAGATHVTWARRCIPENPQIGTHRLAGVGEWATVQEQHKLPAPSRWDNGEVGREGGRGPQMGQPWGGRGFLGSGKEAPLPTERGTVGTGVAKVAGGSESQRFLKNR